jgi:hypothetical protein
VVGPQYGVNFKKNYVTALRQCIYDSLHDGRSETVVGERMKLARLDRARAAMRKLAYLCREEFHGNFKFYISNDVDKFIFQQKNIDKLIFQQKMSINSFFNKKMLKNDKFMFQY